MSTDPSSSRQPIARIAVTGFRGVPATWGGIEHHCEHLYARLAERGYDVTIFARSYYVPAEIRTYRGMTVRRLPTLNTKYTDALFHTLLSVFIILFTKADIVHFHAIGPAFFSWLPRLFRPGMKVFFTCHGLDWQRKKWPRWASRLIYLGELSAVRFPHCRIVVSRELQKYFRSAHGVHTHCIPNGITPVPPLAPDRIKQWGLSRRGYFLCVGRLVPEKRMEDVVTAYLAAPRNIPLVIVGDGTDGSYMNDLRKRAEGNPSIRFTGYQFGPVLQELFANARAFVAASELEGLPITLLEALSYGVMSVTSSIGPHQEVTETLPGLTFPVGDVHALSAHLSAVETMTDRDLDDFQGRAMAMIAERFSWETACDAHDRLYRGSMQHRETPDVSG